jgi:hypothetical protein
MKESNRLKYILYFFFWLFLLNGNNSFGQALNRSNWENVTHGVSYKEDYKEWKSNHRKNNFSLPNFSFPNLSKLKIPLFIFLILIFLVLIYFLIRGGLMAKIRQNRTISVTIENFEEHLDLADLDALLNEALQNRLFYLALRIQFLMVLRSLEQKGYITQKKDKTNGDYLREMYANKYYPEFSQLTVVFEKIWYGNKLINEKDYSLLSVYYQKFKEKVTRNEN